MNDALYFTDSYLQEFKAVVESVKEGKYVILDQTAFYPAGGGQPHDEGVLVNAAGEEFPVAFVGKVGGRISHEIARSGLQPGDKVLGRINWARRYRLMRHHTASHILSGVVFQDTGARITGNQLGLDQSRDDFELETFDRERLKAWEQKTNDILAQNLPVHVRILPREEALKDPSITRLAMEFPPHVQQVRLIDVSGADIQACGGCHVKNTAEIGQIEITKIENKGKNNRRV